MDKTGATGSSYGVKDIWFNNPKTKINNEEDQKKNIDIGNFLNGTKACAYMG